MKQITTTIFLMVAIALSGCSGVTGEFKYMNELKTSISDRYETEKVEINIKINDELVVSLSDPKFNNYSSAQKEQISREIGKLALELREENEKISTGIVNFRDEENYGIARTSSTESSNMYE